MEILIKSKAKQKPPQGSKKHFIKIIAQFAGREDLHLPLYPKKGGS